MEPKPNLRSEKTLKKARNGSAQREKHSPRDEHEGGVSNDQRTRGGYHARLTWRRVRRKVNSSLTGVRVAAKYRAPIGKV